MKKILPFVILALFCLPLSSASLDVPRLQGYVNDYAGMISSSARPKIEEMLRAFEQSDSTQIVILTVPSLGGEPIEEFGIKVGEAWKIGQQMRDNGVIFIVSKQDRKMRIEVGRGLEGRLTDLMAGRIIDQVINPRFGKGDFDGGFEAGVSALINATRGEFKPGQRSLQRGQGTFPRFLTFLLFVGIFVLVLGSLSRILGGVAGGLGLPAVVHLAAKASSPLLLIPMALIGFVAGLLLPRLFSSRGSRRDHSGGRGGGFFYGPGGSDYWHSGGGSDAGGGFSGGGGSFGGGGASGDW